MIFPALAIHLDDLGDMATVVAAAATVALFFAAIWAGRTAERSIDAAASGVQAQIEEQRKIERRRRAYDHLGTLSSRGFTEMSAEAWRVFLLFKGKNEAAATETWKDVSDSDRVAAEDLIDWLGRGDHRYLDQWRELNRTKSPSILPIADSAIGA